MVSDYLNTVRSQLNKPDYIKSLLDAGKKIDQHGSIAERDSPDYFRDRINQLLLLLVNGDFDKAILFRKTFKVSMADIGFINWFFNEILAQMFRSSKPAPGGKDTAHKPPNHS